MVEGAITASRGGAATGTTRFSATNIVEFKFSFHEVTTSGLLSLSDDNDDVSLLFVLVFVLATEEESVILSTGIASIASPTLLTSASSLRSSVDNCFATTTVSSSSSLVAIGSVAMVLMFPKSICISMDGDGAEVVDGDDDRLDTVEPQLLVNSLER